MAGRGTDIRLGGSDERDRERVIALGGLYVLGTNRHESRRIDNQLRGRAGRQGDPGESRFFVSVEDDLIYRHGISDLIGDLLKTGTGSEEPTRLPALRHGEEAGVAPDQSDSSLDDPRIGRNIAHVQRVIEGESFE